MKKLKFLPIFLSLLLLLGALAAPAAALEDPEVDAKTALVMDRQSGEIIWGREVDKRVYPADLTKLVTGLLAVEASETGKISLNDMITVTEAMNTDVPGTGIIGYIDIPKIGVHLPVYHGTSPEVLNIAVGHLEGTSLPVGGAGCHSVISAHRGLPSAKLFTELDQLTEDDQFSISILDDIFTYEVDKISVVLPYETDALRPEPGKDLVTLMTCTPYGINTHRLLVRGHRIDTVAAEDEDAEAHRIRIPADAILIDNMTALPFLIVPLAVILIIYWSLSGKRSGKRYHSAYTVQKELDEKGKDG